MADSEGWQLLEVEIRRRAQSNRDRLMSCKSMEEVSGCQQAVKALEGILVHVDKKQKGVEEG
ncbi:hypothetical protein D3C87_2150340 [compost metagenome]